MKLFKTKIANQLWKTDKNGLLRRSETSENLNEKYVGSLKNLSLGPCESSLWAKLKKLPNIMM